MTFFLLCHNIVFLCRNTFSTQQPVFLLQLARAITSFFFMWIWACDISLESSLNVECNHGKFEQLDGPNGIEKIHLPRLKGLLVLKQRKERSFLSPSNGIEEFISLFLFNQNRVIKLAKGYVICALRITLTKNI